MLIMNKVAVHLLPAPSLVLLCQFMASWVAVKLCGLCGCIVVDELEWKKVKQFWLVSVAFLACVYANIKTLQFANVETFVVFRASTPLFISLCDWCFLGRELPDRRSTAALMGLLGCATGYVLTDASISIKAYAWVAIWYGIFCFDQVYIKYAHAAARAARHPRMHARAQKSRAFGHACSETRPAEAAPRRAGHRRYACDYIEVKSNWGRVFYTNMWASVLSAVIMMVTEPEVMPWNKGARLKLTPEALVALAVSCVLGVSMSYFAFLARSSISATYFTVIGNVCKVITVLINVFIWDKHASQAGMCFLFGSLVCAYFYKQAPMRETQNYDAVPMKGAGF